MNQYKKHIFICTNQKGADKVCCANKGGEAYFLHMKKQLRMLGLHGVGQFRVSQSGCLGRCEQGPCIVIYPEGIWYSYETLADIDEIIDTHLVSHGVVNRLLIPSSE